VSGSTWVSSLLLATTKGVAADVFAQKVVEKRETLDQRRILLWGCFSAVYGGTAVHWIYNILFPRMFPGAATVYSVTSMNLLDNFVNTPFVFYPMFYVMKECLLSRGTMDDAWAKYKDELWAGCVTSW
jgi:protein Mpv17